MLTDERNKIQNPMGDNSLALLIEAIEQLQKVGKAHKADPLTHAIAQLQKIGATLHTRYEMACNGEIAESEMNAEGDDLIADKLQARADKIAASVGLYLYHQTDPRGWPLRVSYSPIADNAYDRAAAIDCRL